MKTLARLTRCWLLCCLLVADGGAAAQTVSGERELEPVVLAPASGAQTAVDLAHLGHGRYLAVWQDMRDGSSEGIYASRITAAGQILDPRGIAISTTYSTQITPRVAAGPGTYLVVWADKRAGKGTSVVRGARIDSNGKLLNSKGFLISTNVGYDVTPVAAHDGKQFIVVWSRARSGSGRDVVFRRIADSGHLLDPLPTAISVGGDVHGLPDVACDGKRCLVVWREEGTDGTGRTTGAVRARRIAPSGKLLDSAPLTLLSPTMGGDGFRPRVAHGAASFLVTWGNDRQVPYEHIYAVQLNGSGTLLDPAPLRVSGAMGTVSAPDVVYDGSNFWISWEDARSWATQGCSGCDRAIVGLKIKPGSTSPPWKSQVLARSPLGLMRPTLAAAYGTVMLALEGGLNDQERDLFVMRFDRTGKVLDKPPGLLLGGGDNVQSAPALFRCGARHLLSWSDRRQVSGAEMRSSFIDATGQPVAAWSPPENTSTPSQLALAGAGDRYLLVWGTSAALRARRITADGKSLDSVPLTLASGAPGWSLGFVDGAEVAHDGSGWLVVWRSPGTNHLTSVIRRARVNAAGKVLDPGGVRLTGSSGPQEFSPEVTFGHGRFVLAWIDHGLGGSSVGMGKIQLAQINRQGTLVGAPQTLARTNTRFDSVRLSTGQNTTLVLWGDLAKYSYERSNLWGAILGKQGKLLSKTSFVLCSVRNTQINPVVSFGDSRYLVVWQDFRGKSVSDLYGTRVDETGRVETPAGFVVSATANEESNPTLAYSGEGRFLVAYDGKWLGPTRRNPTGRIRTRTVSWLANGQPCTSGDSCESTLCVDGVCCDWACGGSTADCLACSRVAGGVVDGRCGPSRATWTCRAAKGECDQAERCDGSSPTCPKDRLVPDQTPCSGGVCRGGICAVARADAGRADGADAGRAAITDRGCACEASRASDGQAVLLPCLLLVLLVLKRKKAV